MRALPQTIVPLLRPVVCTLVLLLPLLHPVSAGDLTLKDQLREILSESKVVGASIAWTKNNKQHSLHYGFSNSLTQKQTNLETRFRAGSVSKLATALITLRAQEQGLLSLNDPIEKHLPNILEGPKTWRNSVTIASLLEHTSGLAGSSYREYSSDRAGLSPSDYISLHQPFPLRWEPHFHYSYSNPGYTIVGAILEKTYDLTFDEIAEQQLFAPLQMHSSSFENTYPLKHLSQTYDSSGKQIHQLWEMPVRPAGALVSTSADLLRLTEMLIHRGKGPNNTTFLPTSSLHRMEHAETSLAARNGATTGAYALGNFGFTVQNKIFRGHWGRTDGFQTNLGYLHDENTGFVILLNTADRAVANPLRRVIVDYLTKNTTETPPQPTTTKTKPIPGTYVNFSHDMPMRSWLFGLLEAKRITPTPSGIAIRSLYLPHSPSQSWTEVSPNLYQAQGTPVPTGTFASQPEATYWVDGESFIRRHTALVYAEAAIIATALLSAACGTTLLPALLLLRKKPKKSTIALFLASSATLLLVWLFWTHGLAGTGRALGKLTFVSATLLIASLTIPIASLTSITLSSGSKPNLILSIPLLLFSIQLLSHQWLPLVTFLS